MTSKNLIYLGNKANDAPKNNKPKEQMELKALLQKAVIESIKNANVPGIMEPSSQLFGTLAWEVTLLFDAGIQLETDSTCTIYTRLAI